MSLSLPYPKSCTAQARTQRSCAAHLCSIFRAARRGFYVPLQSHGSVTSWKETSICCELLGAFTLTMRLQHEEIVNLVPVCVPDLTDPSSIADMPAARTFPSARLARMVMRSRAEHLCSKCRPARRVPYVRLQSHGRSVRPWKETSMFVNFCVPSF